MAHHTHDCGNAAAGADVAAPDTATPLPPAAQPRSTAGRAVRRGSAASDWAGAYRVEHLVRIDEPTRAPVWAVLADSLSTKQAAERVAAAHRASTGKPARVIERHMVFIRGEVRTRPVPDDAHLLECPPT